MGFTRASRSIERGCTGGTTSGGEAERERKYTRIKKKGGNEEIELR